MGTVRSKGTLANTPSRSGPTLCGDCLAAPIGMARGEGSPCQQRPPANDHSRKGKRARANPGKMGTKCSFQLPTSKLRSQCPRGWRDQGHQTHSALRRTPGQRSPWPGRHVLPARGPSQRQSQRVCWSDPVGSGDSEGKATHAPWGWQLTPRCPGPAAIQKWAAASPNKTPCLRPRLSCSPASQLAATSPSRFRARPAEQLPSPLSWAGFHE